MGTYMAPWKLAEKQAHNFKSVGNDADGHKLLAVVAAVHHEGIGETLNDGAVGLAKAFDGIAAGRVRDVDGGADLDVVTVEKELVSQNPRRPAVQGHSGQVRVSEPRGSPPFRSPKLQVLLTSVKYLGLRHPRMTTC